MDENPYESPQKTAEQSSLPAAIIPLLRLVAVLLIVAAALYLISDMLAHALFE